MRYAILLMLMTPIALGGCGAETEPDPFERGVAALEAGDADTALRLFNAVLARTPDDAEALVNRGLAQAARGRHAHALADYTAAIRIDAAYQDAYVNRGVLLLETGNAVDAIDDFNRAIELDSEDADAYRNRGFAWHALEEWDATIVDLTRAIVLSEALDPVLFRDRADAWKAKGDMEQAASDYAIADGTEALLLDPEDVTARLSRGTAFRDIGAYEMALVDLGEVLRLRRQSPTALLVRGDVHFLTDDTARALADYTAAIEIDPDHVAARVSRGGLHEAAGRWTAAFQDYAAAVDADPTHAGAVTGLAWLLATSPDPSHRDGARAKALLEPLCEASRFEDWALLDAYAAAAAELGDWPTAVTRATQALERAPEEMGAELEARLAGYMARAAHRLASAEE